MNRKKQIFFIFIIFFFEFAYASGSNDNIAEIKKINTIQAAKIKDLAKKRSVLENKLSAQQKKLQELENNIPASSSGEGNDSSTHLGNNSIQNTIGANEPEQYSGMRITNSRNSSISEMEDKKTSNNTNLEYEELSKEISSSPKSSSTSKSKENILDEQSVSVDQVEETNLQEKSTNFLEVAELRNDIAQIQENLADLQGQKEQLEIDYEQEKKRFEEIKELRSALNDEIVKEKSLFQLQTEVEKQRELLREGKEEAEKERHLRR